MKKFLLSSLLGVFLLGFGGISHASITFQFYASNEAESPCYTTTTPQYNQSPDEDAYYTLYNYDDELLNNCASTAGKTFLGYKMSRENADSNSRRHIDNTIDTNSDAEPQVDVDEIYRPVKYVFSTNDVILKAYAQWGTGISEINITGPNGVSDGDDFVDWDVDKTDGNYSLSCYPVEWDGDSWEDATHESAVSGTTIGIKVILHPEDGYAFPVNPTINYNGENRTNSGNTTFDSTTNTLYIDLGIVGAGPIEIEHILLIGDLGRFVHGTTPPTNITTNTTGINLGAVTWGKGSSCTPLEANETFVSSSNYDDYYCLTIPFTVDTGYVLRNNYYIYRKNIGADRSTNRVYASDYEYACTASEIKIKYLYAEHTIDFMVDGQPRNDTRYRRNGCTLWECGSYGAYPQQPTKDGHVFEGWYTEETFDNKWNWYSSGITENITLYANWLNKINTITISGITVPTSGAQATLEGIEKSADPTAGINRGTLVWKVPTNDNSEDPQPIDFNGTFQGGKSYRLYVPFTIAEGYGIQKGYSNTTIFTVNGTQKDINYDISCSNSLCSAWLSYYVPYIITFYDGETVYTTGTAYAGDTIDYTWSITNPYVSGKKFLGWFKDPEFTQQRRLDTDTVTGDMNLYGKFANQLTSINLTGVVAPEGNVTATVAGISLAEGTSGVQLGTLKWKEGESDFNGKYVSGTQYTLYVPFKLIDDYVMPDYYSYVSLNVNGEYFYKEIGSTGNEDYPYYIRTYFTAKAPATGTSEPAPSAGGSSGGGGGGGGIIVTNDKQETEVKNTENNKQDEDKSEENKSEEKQENNTETPGNPQNDSQKVLEDGLTQEFHDAYDFAYKNGITTMPTAKEANMKGPLTRIAMAKMLSNYAINVLGKKPANKVVPKFPDVDEKLNEDYGGAVDLAYQLGIMGINIENFRPYDLVPRSEFATALSRMLYGTADGEGAYYETHLKQLKEKGIITNDNPNLQEARGYVMIMLMRSAK